MKNLLAQCEMDSLGICFLDEGAPELVRFGRVNEDELPVPRGQQVVHNYVNPPARPVELEENTDSQNTKSLL